VPLIPNHSDGAKSPKSAIPRDCDN
jgi:hypothetical protein